MAADIFDRVADRPPSAPGDIFDRVSQQTPPPMPASASDLLPHPDVVDQQTTAHARQFAEEATRPAPPSPSMLDRVKSWAGTGWDVLNTNASQALGGGTATDLWENAGGAAKNLIESAMGEPWERTRENFPGAKTGEFLYHASKVIPGIADFLMTPMGVATATGLGALPNAAKAAVEALFATQMAKGAGEAYHRYKANPSAATAGDLAGHAAATLLPILHAGGTEYQNRAREAYLEKRRSAEAEPVHNSAGHLIRPEQAALTPDTFMAGETKEKPNEPTTVEQPRPAATAIEAKPEGGEEEPAARRPDAGAGERGGQTAGEPTEAKPVDRPATQRGEPGWVGNVPTSDIQVDAPRFQFKRNVGQGGAGDEFREVSKWDPEKAGVVSVWRDPADGKTYVVNGHHRVEMAQRLKAPEMTVRYLNAENAPQARAKGALINIAEGRGESTDAARVFRDTGMSSEDLQKEGVSLKGKIAKEGLAVSRLAQPIYDDVMTGDLAPARGAVIGEGVANPQDQLAVYDLMKQREQSGKRMTNDQVAELARLASSSPQRTETQDSLFGPEEMTRSLLPERAEVSDYVRKQLGAERKLFGVVGTQGAAERLGEAGNVIKPEENKQRADTANQGLALYDKLSTVSGPIGTALDRASQRIADGEKTDDVKRETYRQIKSALAGETDRLAGIPQGDAGRVERDGGEGPREARVRERDPRAQSIAPDPAPAPEIGPHGPIHREFAGKPLEALAWAREQQNGFATGAIPHPSGAIGLPVEAPASGTSISVPKAPKSAGPTPPATGYSTVPLPTGGNLDVPGSTRTSGGETTPSPDSGAPSSSIADPKGESALRQFLGDEEGTSRVGAIFRAGIHEMAALKAKRDAAMAALEKAQSDPAEKAFGQRVVEYYTGERDLWSARVNQVMDRLRKLVPDHVDQEGISILRDFKGRPGELEQWAKGTHPNLASLKPDDYTAAMRNIDRLRPSIERAMNPTPRMVQADEVLTKIADASAREGVERGFLERGLDAQRYFTHLLYPKGEGQIPVSAADRLGQSLGGKIGRRYAFAEHREYRTVLDAIADNVKPKTLNAFDAFTIHGDKFATARATHLLVDQLHDSGVGKWGSHGSKDIPKGWVEIAPHARLFRNDVEFTDQNGEKQLGSQTLWVPPAFEKALRPITDPDYMDRLPGFRQLRSLQQYTKAVQLGLSFFHATTENYMAMANMGPRGWIRGLRADRESPEFQRAEREFIVHGGTTSVQGRTIEAYKALEPGSIPTWGDIWRRAPGIHEVDQLAQKLTDFTFGKLQRQFKVTDYSLHKAAWMAEHPEATAVEQQPAMASIAKEINAVYGGLNWEHLGINHMTTEVARAVMLAPDWTISNIFNIKYAMERGTPGGKLARAFWARQLAGGMTATQLMSLALSRQPSKNPTQVYMGKDKNGEEIYQNIFFKGAAGDAINLVHNVGDYGAVQGLARSMAGKAAPVFRTGINLMTNRDYLGREVVPKGMNPLASTVRGVWEAAKGMAPMPLSAANLKDMLTGPESDKYTVPEWITTPFAGNPPRHVAPEGTRMTKHGLKPARWKANRSMWDEIVTGKR